jgi:hypothetical protein
MSCSCLFAILAGLPVLTALVSGVIFYYQYLHSPEKCWQDRVFDVVSTARKQAQSEKASLRQIAPNREAATHAAKEEAFRSYLAGISVSELEAYTGIGHATIAKLRSAGYSALAALRDVRPEVHGLGDKRLADIDFAVRDLSEKAQRDFDAGACSQALALPDKLRELLSTYARRESLIRARIQATEEVGVSLRDFETAALGVTFWRWLRPRLLGKCAPPELMDAPLPDLDAAVKDSQRRAAQAWEVKHRKAAANGRKDSKESPAATPAPVVRTPPVAQGRAAVHALALPSDQVNIMLRDAHLLLMELTVQFCLVAARVDGPVTSAGRDLIRQHMRQRYGYDRALLNRADGFYAHYESAAIDVDHCLRQVKGNFTGSHRTALVEFASQIIAVSSNGGAASATFLKSLSQRLGIPTVAPPKPESPAKAPTVPPIRKAQQPIAAVLPQTVPAREECLAMLEISSGESLSAGLVRRQWNLLSERMAPTIAARLGPEFLKLAETKRAALLQAAEILLNLMGEKLEVKQPAPAARDLRHNPDLDDVFGGM